MTPQEQRNALANEIRRVRAGLWNSGHSAHAQRLGGLRFAADNIACVDQRKPAWPEAYICNQMLDSRGNLRKRRSGCVADRRGDKQ